MRAVLQSYLDRGQLFVTQKETCKILGITSPSYYKLRALGLAPKETRFPGTHLIRICIEELDRWLGERENPGKAERIEIAKQRAQMKLLSDIAVASMKHARREEKQT